MRISDRFRLSIASAVLLTFTVSGIASACVLTSKTINTEAGSCAAGGGTNCDSAATYGANGFTGSLTFSDAGANTIWDFICTKLPNSSTFTTFGGTYHLSLFNGATLLGSGTYTVTGGQTCGGLSNYAKPAAGVAITVPSSRVVQYTLSIEGVTSGSNAQAAFAGFASLRNEAFGSQYDVARSWVVPPPTNFIIPEAPFAILLPLSAGLLAAAFVMKRSGKATAIAA
jgi:hypothetical protein